MTAVPATAAQIDALATLFNNVAKEDLPMKEVDPPKDLNPKPTVISDPTNSNEELSIRREEVD